LLADLAIKADEWEDVVLFDLSQDELDILIQPFEHSEHDKDITCINVGNFITYPSEASCFKASIFKIIYFCFS